MYAVTRNIGIPAVVLSTLIKFIEVLQALMKYFIYDFITYYSLKVEESA